MLNAVYFVVNSCLVDTRRGRYYSIFPSAQKLPRLYIWTHAGICIITLVTHIYKTAGTRIL